MTTQNRPPKQLPSEPEERTYPMSAARIAKRVVEAAEKAGIEPLRNELGRTEQWLQNQWFCDEEERLDLLQAITRDMEQTVRDSSDLDAISPHLQLMKHLAQNQVWIN